MSAKIVLFFDSIYYCITKLFVFRISIFSTVFYNISLTMKKTLIASVKGTKAETVSAILLKIPKEEREKVREVTMDFSDSMYSIVKTCFPNATIVIDCFHIVQRLCEALDEMRLRFKRLAVTKTKKEAAEHNQREDEKARKRKYNREWYASHKASKNVKGKKRGRKRIRKRKFKPQTFSNGDTRVELLTRARTILYKSGEKWGKSQKTRAKIYHSTPRLKALRLNCTEWLTSRSSCTVYAPYSANGAMLQTRKN